MLITICEKVVIELSYPGPPNLCAGICNLVAIDTTVSKDAQSQNCFLCFAIIAGVLKLFVASEFFL